MADLSYLTTFFVDWQARGIIGDTFDPGFNPDAFKPWCDILFTPKLIGQDSQEIAILNQDPMMSLLLLPIAARLESGVLKAVRGPAPATGPDTPTAEQYNEQVDSVGVPLIAETPALELPAGVHLIYRVHFEPMKINGGQYKFDDFDFAAPTSATRINLTSVERINLPPSSDNQLVLRLIPDDARIEGMATLVLSASGVDLGDGLDLGPAIEAAVESSNTWQGFTHTQSAPAATWTIANPLGRKATSVTVLVGNVVVEADVTMPDDATTPIAVVFATPQSGRAQII
ncbi:uncharacterized protein RMCC_1414 [Mycolicibacterium canariasense]|uniref:Uncharacterized protein n=1 Tax=Mycolicibacterium canariasense TaxID=228230 RepID=A0A100WAB5_MYCCR|nr:hypothetical protein [Mycolicibacterium canariasense]MCV7208766.1 hypothetical protein [Mycolicibacterium canariasense]ORV07166.1 hypothetical protein AWB94_14300 [Mycolicibacterium canariasense]GAS94448.1 uncharacterized protein RMCC_1414 [Mycolicibacterium canariasense]